MENTSGTNFLQELRSILSHIAMHAPPDCTVRAPAFDVEGLTPDDCQALVSWVMKYYPDFGYFPAEFSHLQCNTYRLVLHVYTTQTPFTEQGVLKPEIVPYEDIEPQYSSRAEVHAMLVGAMQAAEAHYDNPALSEETFCYALDLPVGLKRDAFDEILKSVANDPRFLVRLKEVNENNPKRLQVFIVVYANEPGYKDPDL